MLAYKENPKDLQTNLMQYSHFSGKYAKIFVSSKGTCSKLPMLNTQNKRVKQNPNMHVSKTFLVFDSEPNTSLNVRKNITKLQSTTRISFICKRRWIIN